jgi:hypothetical protein
MLATIVRAASALALKQSVYCWPAVTEIACSNCTCQSISVAALMETLTSLFQVKGAVTPVNTLPLNWPWPVLKVPLLSNSVPTAPLELEEEELDDELELLDDELELELEEELLDDELLDDELVLLELLEEELEEVLELLEDELLEDVPPHAVKTAAIALTHSSLPHDEESDPGLKRII